MVTRFIIADALHTYTDDLDQMDKRLDDASKTITDLTKKLYHAEDQRDYFWEKMSEADYKWKKYKALNRENEYNYNKYRTLYLEGCNKNKKRKVDEMN